MGKEQLLLGIFYIKQIRTLNILVKIHENWPFIKKVMGAKTLIVQFQNEAVSK